MRSVRVTNSLEIISVLLAMNNGIAKAFHAGTNGVLLHSRASTKQHECPSCLFSSMQPPAKDSDRASSESPSSSRLTIVNASALIGGPAHAAALESTAREESTDEPQRIESDQSPSEMQQNSKTNLMQSIRTKYSTVSPTNANAEEPLPPPTPVTQNQPIPKVPPSTNKRQTTKSINKGPVTTVETMEELLAIMDGEHDASAGKESSLSLILFHAHYCKICQRATMQLTRAAKDYPSVHFAKVEAKVFPEPAGDNLRMLGVSKFPFVQIYRKRDCVASFSTGPTHMFLRKVRETLDMCIERDTDSWEQFSNEFSNEIEANRDARRSLGPPELLP